LISLSNFLTLILLFKRQFHFWIISCQNHSSWIVAVDQYQYEVLDCAVPCDRRRGRPDSLEKLVGWEVIRIQFCGWSSSIRTPPKPLSSNFCISFWIVCCWLDMIWLWTSVVFRKSRMTCALVEDIRLLIALNLRLMQAIPIIQYYGDEVILWA
jgi:hypothetical protein